MTTCAGSQNHPAARSRCKGAISLIILYLLALIAAAALLYLLFLAVCALAVPARREYDQNSRFYRSLLNGLIGLALPLLRVRIHITGMEKIPAEGRVLFVGNHRSNFDPIVTLHAFRKWQIAFLSKEENFRIPLIGRIIRPCCFMIIDRDSPRRAMETIRRAAALLSGGEVSVGVYPEGTRSREGGLLPFHNGVFKIARKAQAAVVVLAVSGTEKIAKNFPFHRSEVFLQVADVIAPEEVCRMRTEQTGERVRKKLEEALREEGAPCENTRR